MGLARRCGSLHLTSVSVEPQALHGGAVSVLPSPSSTCMLCFTTMELLQELVAVQDLIWTMGQRSTR